MKIKVQFDGLVTSIVGNSQEEITLPAGATLKDLLKMLVARHGEDFCKLVMMEGDQIRPLARILVNGQEVFQLGGADISLDGVPQVSIVISLPYIAGG